MSDETGNGLMSSGPQGDLDCIGFNAELEREAKLRKVRALLQLRDSRSKLFGPRAFSDPAWEVVLRLFEAHLEGSAVQTAELVSSISSVPTSTLLRFIASLEQEKRVFRSEREGEEVLNLTLGTLAGMHALFEIVPGAAVL